MSDEEFDRRNRLNKKLTMDEYEYIKANCTRCSEIGAQNNGGADLNQDGIEMPSVRIIGVTANIRLVDKVTWMNTVLQDAPWDMHVEDLLSLLTLDSNAFLSTTGSAWNQARHTDTKVDDYYARYAREMDSAKRKAIGKELLEYMADKMYWNTISGSPFYMVSQPWVKGYVYNAEFEVHWGNVWLDK